MSSAPVVKQLDVFKDGAFSLTSGSEGVIVKPFHFQLTPKRFHRGVVVAVSLSAHAANETIASQQLLILFAGILHAPVRMNQQTPLCAGSADCLFEC